MFPEIIRTKSEVIHPKTPIDVSTFPANIQQALSIIPEDEYDLITEPDDIFVDSVNLSSADKRVIFESIDAYKNRVRVGGSRRSKTRRRRHKRMRHRRGKHSKRRTRRLR